MDALPGRAHNPSGRLAAKEAEREAYRLWRLQFVLPVVIFVVVSSLTEYVTTWTSWTLDGLNFGGSQVAAPEAAIGMVVEATAWVAPILVIFLAATMVTRGYAEKKMMMMSLGMLMAFAAASGVFVGYTGYSWYMRLYNAYSDGREYYNVLPTEPAAAHLDAGKIMFSSTASVDETKSIGFNDGMMYCVAPIVAPNQGSRIEFWAVGTNCCKRRSSFWCSAAGKPGRGGIVQLDSGFFRTNAIDVWSLAVRVAEAQFDLQSSPHAVFVKYVDDPDYEHQQQFNHGMLLWLVASGIYLIVNTLIALLSRRFATALGK
jgi:heme/copper-type cytochrome/quinol oxidase subunit 2